MDRKKKKKSLLKKKKNWAGLNFCAVVLQTINSALPNVQKRIFINTLLAEFDEKQGKNG